MLRKGQYPFVIVLKKEIPKGPVKYVYLNKLDNRKHWPKKVNRVNYKSSK